ncbi:dihydrofolate reductase [Reinekea forsetii]|nr:dihydrofolate reductase [Reinekea forsetii]
MKISLIWAMSENNVIGRDNKLPWHLPNDLKYFKRLTTGKPVIMGRKTYESIGRPLPNRTNIVITRDQGYQVDGVKVVNTLEAAIELAEANCLINAQDEVIVMGGAEIYKLALPSADRLYVTLVHAQVEGDAYFPDIDLTQYKEVTREFFEKDGPNPYDYSFCVFEKQTH